MLLACGAACVASPSAGPTFEQPLIVNDMGRQKAFCEYSAPEYARWNSAWRERAMARAFFRSFEAHSYSYVTRRIVIMHRQSALAVADIPPCILLVPAAF